MRNENILTRISKTRNGTETKESNHNFIKTVIKPLWNKSKATKAEAVFNLKNKEYQKVFKEETSNNSRLSKVFDEEEVLDKATERFMKKINKLL